MVLFVGRIEPLKGIDLSLIHIFRPETDLLDLDFLLTFAGLAFFFGAFVLELAKIHQPTNRRVSLRSNLHEVRIVLPGHRQRFTARHNAQLFAILTDDPKLR